MTEVLSAITVLSCSLFVCSLIKILAPTGKTEKIIRLVISVFVLICIATCFKSVINAIDLPAFEASNSVTDEALLKETGDYMAEYIDKLLISENLDAEVVEVTVEADENKVINVSEVSIYINQRDMIYKEKITELIKSYINIEPFITLKE